MLLELTLTYLFARKKYGTVNHFNFVVGSCENFPAGPYDLVFCNHVLHWVENIETAFENMHRNLTPGGIFALCAVAYTGCFRVAWKPLLARTEGVGPGTS